MGFSFLETIVEIKERAEQGGVVEMRLPVGKVFIKEQKKSRPPKGAGIETLNFPGRTEDYVS
jgi:hypothetical protein